MTTLELDNDGYPTEASLDAIAHAPIRSYADCAGLLDDVRRVWVFGGYWEQAGGTYRLSTGGWSGNEAIVAALQANPGFWALCWASSTHGGSHVFEVRGGV